MPNPFLTEADVTRIKQRLWDGELQRQVARDFDVIESTISNIAAGYKWPYVKWPNGAEGGMPRSQRRAIIKARREAAGTSRGQVRRILRSQGEDSS